MMPFLVDFLQSGYQVLVFTHSRKDTVTTARAIRDTAMSEGTISRFSCEQSCGRWKEWKQKVLWATRSARGTRNRSRNGCCAPPDPVHAMCAWAPPM